MNRFEGKIVIVTGAGSGSGAGTARRFLREGAFVTLTGGAMHEVGAPLSGVDLHFVRQLR